VHVKALDSYRKNLLSTAIKASLLAGNGVMQVYDSDFEVNLKGDRSPITDADRRSHRIIVERLGKEIPLLSEEGSKTDYEERKNWYLYWLIDPLDGTKEFIKRNGEFTVNVALMERQHPVAGIVYLPAKEILFFGGRGFGAYRVSGSVLDRIGKSEPGRALESALAAATSLPDPVSLQALGGIKVVQSISHVTEQEADFTGRLEDHFGPIEKTAAGSSLKFCLVAEGNADVYPRFGPTMEWDTAAGQCVAESSGCEVLNIEDLTPLGYNKQVLRNRAFVVIGSRFRDGRLSRESILSLAQTSSHIAAHH
jgi:3'(2'), 5'-bisphosphate nucleotidase